VQIGNKYFESNLVLSPFYMLCSKSTCQCMMGVGTRFELDPNLIGPWIQVWIGALRMQIHKEDKTSGKLQ
jgi:hypothetical protein